MMEWLHILLISKPNTMRISLPDSHKTVNTSSNKKYKSKNLLFFWHWKFPTQKITNAQHLLQEIWANAHETRESL